MLESQAFGPYQARVDTGQAQPSGAKSDTPGQIGGVQLDAATPAGHAMQQATHAEGCGPAGAGESSDLKAVITDWLEKVLLPAINAEVCAVLTRHKTTGNSRVCSGMCVPAAQAVCVLGNVVLGGLKFTLWVVLGAPSAGHADGT